MANFIPNIEIEGAHILFRNFRGEERDFNPAGKRNFSVLIDAELAEKLQEDGWNLKPLRMREDDTEQKYHLPVAVSFDNFPPNVWLIAGRKKTRLDEDSVGILDNSEITNADLIIRPYSWTKGRDSGVKAYLKTAYITIRQDRFAEKYADVGDPVEDEDLPF